MLSSSDETGWVMYSAGFIFTLFNCMKTNYHLAMPKENNRGRMHSKQRPDKKIKKNKNVEQNSKLVGFSTLSQVSGLPPKTVFHSRLSVPPEKVVKEPHVICHICKEKIDLISEALTDPSGEYVHFDCAIRTLKESYRPRENQTISYIGRGNFALCEKTEDGKWMIVERIPYESSESNEKMKNYVESLKV